MEVRGFAGWVLLTAAVSPAFGGGLVYQTQSRSISAITSADGNSQAVSAPDFAPFVQAINLTAEIPTTTGPTTTRGNPAIDCQLDPNAIRTTGSLTAAGGISIAGGTPTVEFGEARGDVIVTFEVTIATPFTLTASERPSGDPADSYELRLRDVSHGHSIIELDQTSPPQAVNISSVINPGTYELRYVVELHSDGSELTAPFSLNFALHACGSADFDGDGSSGTDADIQSFFSCLAGSCCPTCGSADFNGDGDTGTDADIEAFFRVLAGGTC